MRANLFLGALLVLLSTSGATFAHPFGKLAYDRTIRAVVTPDRVRLTYQLEVDAVLVFQAVPKLDPNIDLMTLRGPRDFQEAFLRRLRVLLPDQAWAKIDQGDELVWKLVAQTAEIGENEHLLATFVLEAPVILSAGAHSIRFKDLSFEGHAGLIAWELHAESGIVVKMRHIPGADEPLEERRREMSATIEVTAPPIPVAPPDIEPAPIDETVKGEHAGLTALFDSKSGLGILLLLAAFFGAGHALTPGHGKTLVAAYLIGERGTMFHALMLGMIVTLTHTGSVMLVAGALYWFFPDTMPAQVQVLLGFIGGFLIFGLGLWMLLRRVAGQADHVHIGGGHHHHHADSHDHHHAPTSMGRVGWGQLIILGITGGIVPCTDALALLGIAITAGRLALAIPLLLAFSAGLAAVLVAIGMAVVYAQRHGLKEFNERRWFRALPIASAALLMILGIMICRAALRSGSF